MAYVLANGFDVEHASSLLVYENLFPQIQHINGKGCTDKYTKTNDVENVQYIDIMRVLPYAPRFRKIGSANNGAWHNKKNEGGYGNAPQSTHYTIPVDLYYDEGVQISSPQDYSNPVNLEQIIMAQLVNVAAMSINVITYAKQIEAYFRNGDNFDKALTHEKGAIVAGDISATEIANAVFAYDPSVSGATANSPSNAFINANSELSGGIPEIGAFVVPSNARQAFISNKYDALMKSQYMQNASEAAARILATGFINPFNDKESKRIDENTGLCGTYDGVDLFMFNNITRYFTYVALGISGTTNDEDATLTKVRGLLDKLNGMIVYGAGTCRGIVGPNILANANFMYGGVYVLPQMKVGVEVLHGATIKCIVNGGTGLADNWTADDIATIMNKIEFTPIDGEVVKGTMSGFNDGTSN